MFTSIAELDGEGGSSTGDMANSPASVRSESPSTGGRNPLRPQRQASEDVRNDSFTPLSSDLNSTMGVGSHIDLVFEFIRQRPRAIFSEDVPHLLRGAQQVVDVTTRLCLSQKSNDHALLMHVWNQLQKMMFLCRCSPQLVKEYDLDTVSRMVTDHQVDVRDLRETQTLCSKVRYHLQTSQSQYREMVFYFSRPTDTSLVLDMFLGVVLAALVLAVGALSVVEEAYFMLIPVVIGGVLPLVAGFYTFYLTPHWYWLAAGMAAAFLTVQHCIAVTVYDYSDDYPLHLGGLPIAVYFFFRLRAMHREHVHPVFREEANYAFRPAMGTVGVLLCAFIYALSFLIRVAVSENHRWMLLVGEGSLIVFGLAVGYAVTSWLTEHNDKDRALKEYLEIAAIDLFSELHTLDEHVTATDVPELVVANNLGAMDDTAGRITLSGADILEEGEMLVNAFGFRGIQRVPLIGVHLSTAIIGIDMRGIITLWNPFAEELTNFGAMEVLGKSLFTLLLPPTTTTQIRRIIDSVSIDRVVPITEMSLTCNGAAPVVKLDLNCFPAKAASGETVGVVFVGAPQMNRQLPLVLQSLLDIHSDVAAKQESQVNGGMQAPPVPFIGARLSNSGSTSTNSKTQRSQSPLKSISSQLAGVIAEVRRMVATSASSFANIANLLGPLMRSEAFSSAVQYDVDSELPPLLSVDEDHLSAVLRAMLTHYVTHGAVALRMRLASGTLDSESVVISISPASRKVPKYEPSAEINSHIRSCHGYLETVVDEPTNATRLFLLGAAKNATAAMSESNNSITSPMETSVTSSMGSPRTMSVVDMFNDPVRATVALHCTDPVASSVVRQVVWGRRHLLYLVEKEHHLPVAVEGIDLLFVYVPQTGGQSLRQHIVDIAERKPKLIIVGLLGGMEKPPEMWISSGIGHFVPHPILTPHVHAVLSHTLKKVAEHQSQNQKMLEIKKLLSTTRTCPWVRGKLLGKGTFATVYEATNTLTSGKMAVRMVPINAESQEQLEETMNAIIEEIKLMSELDHKNVINYLYCERGETTLNIFVEYASGGSLKNIIDKRGGQTPQQVSVWLQDILDGLDYLHTRNIAHLDLKAANVLLSASGAAKLCDFGTAKKLNHQSISGSGSSSNHKESAVGTLSFMAPEVINGTRFDEKSDIWSIGCLVIELLTGKLPFSHIGQGTLGVVGYIGSLQPKQAVDLPGSITDPDAIHFINMCLTVDPLMRPTVKTLIQHPFLTESVRRPSTAISIARVRRGPSSQVSQFDDDESRRDSCFSTWSGASSMRNFSLQARSHNAIEQPVRTTSNEPSRAERVKVEADMDTSANFFM